MHFWLTKRHRQRWGFPALAAAGAAVLTATLGVAPAHAAANSAAAPPPTLSVNTNAPCNVTPKHGFAQCLAIVRTTTTHNLRLASSNQPPATALGPADLQAAYKLPSLGAGQTVAIVDAYGDSNAESDLAAFRAQYGLPACTTANGCFRKVDQAGGTNYPADDAGWGLETSLDLDAVSSACPKCNILLVQGNSSSVPDLGAAVNEAVALGAKFVSNSYGAPDGSGDSYSADYTHAGVAIVASTGDAGDVVQWPSAIGTVTAAGGTKLTKDTAVSRGWDESAWVSGGSGCSMAEPQPDTQVGLATGCTMRATADISADADPASGLAIYDTLGQGGWMQVGGTSLSAPLITAMYAMAGTPVAGTYPVSYAYHDKNPAADLFDITSGSNGSCGNVLCNAGPGWDGPTGLGTPDGLGALSSGPQAIISGQVTDSTAGKPLANVTVTASPGNYQTRTDASGKYELDVTAGSYTVTGSLYAFQTATDTGVQATANQTVTANLSLAELPHTTLSGTVKDGSGHGWPVYAQITIGGGYSGGPVYTDPFTGKYSVTLAGPATYPVTISAAAPAVTGQTGDGYQPLSTQVSAGTTPQTADFTLSADKNTCTALGYGYPGLNEHFTTWTGTTPQDGWTVTGSQAGWRFDNPGDRPPPTMTTGSDAFAIADSGTSGGHMDTTLTSPAADLSGQHSPVLSFQSEYYGAAGQQGTIELSTDGGSTWTPVWHHTTDNAVSMDPYTTIAVPAAAGKHDVRVRFHYTGTSAWWWSVGNIHLGDPGCAALPGGLVTGLVTDTTGQEIDGATVTATAQPGVSGIAASADDSSVKGALYTVFSPAAGSQQFTAAASGYGSSTATANVTADQLTRQDFTLTATANAAARHVSTTQLATSAARAKSSSAPTGQLTPVSMPGLKAKSYTITLITGDQVRLSATGKGRYAFDVTRSAAGGDQAVHISGVTSRKGSTTLQAIPSSATPLLTSGAMDPGLFDLGWLATHGDTGPDATLPVVLKSATAAGATAVAKTAAALPGVKVTSVSAGAGTVQVTVSASRAAAFWAAVTGNHAQPAAGLANGIAGIWLDGHRTADARPELADGQRLVTVSQTILGAPHGDQCQTTRDLCIASINQSLIGLSGAGADSNFAPDSIACVRQTTSGVCDAQQITYRVPVGVYSVSSYGDFYDGPDLDYQQVDLSVPQLTVAGNTSFTVDATTARKLTVGTPRPGDRVGLVTLDQVITPSGAMNFAGTLYFYGNQGAWAVPSGAKDTTGTFNSSVEWRLQAPIITMSTAGTTLHPWYEGFVDNPADPEFARFTGSQKLQLVAAGIGSAADFAKVDARGKLALISLDPLGGCLVLQSQLANALNAGAVGLIVDPTLDPSANLGRPVCFLPIGIDPIGVKPVKLPYVAVPAPDAKYLRQALAAGPVSINVTDHGDPSYLYDLKFYTEGVMPANPAHTVTGNDLARVDTTLSADAPSLVGTVAHVFRPDERYAIGDVTLQHGQTTQTQYFGPLSPSDVWQRMYYNDYGTGTTVGDSVVLGVVSRSDTSAVDAFSRPTVPGASQIPHTVTAAEPGLWEPSTVCAFCRQGDVFYPFYFEKNGEPVIAPIELSTIDPSQAHLYANGQEIPASQVGGYPAYKLPSGQASYRFTMTDGDTNTAWTYNSATPTANQTPAAYACAGSILLGSTDPCAPTPLILLSYNAFVSPSNTVTADSNHEIDVTPYYQEGSTPATSTKLQLWFSTDGGKTWQEVHVTAHDGTYTGHYQLPALAATSGSVSLKAQATDSAGTTVSQTVLNGYKITG